MIFSLFQLIGGLIVAFCYIPQILQIIKTKSSKDLNLYSFVLLLIGLILMEVYAFYILLINAIVMYFITNTINIIGLIILLFLIKKYKR